MKRFQPHPLHIVLGFIIWAAFFSILYGGQAVGCAVARPPDEAGARTWLNAVLLLFTLGTTVLLLVMTWIAHGSTPVPGGNRHFMMRVATALYLVAAIATLLVGLPAVVLPPCL